MSFFFRVRLLIEIYIKILIIKTKQPQSFTLTKSKEKNWIKKAMPDYESHATATESLLSVSLDCCKLFRLIFFCIATACLKIFSKYFYEISTNYNLNI